MSQKIPQPRLQGSPWASGETGSSSTGGRMRCVSQGAFCRFSEGAEQVPDGKLGVWEMKHYVDSKEEKA